MFVEQPNVSDMKHLIEKQRFEMERAVNFEQYQMNLWQNVFNQIFEPTSHNMDSATERANKAVDEFTSKFRNTIPPVSHQPITNCISVRGTDAR